MTKRLAQRILDDQLIPGIAMTRRELLAAAMRRLRVQRGWSLSSVAARAGVNESQISRAENGIRRPMTAAVLAGIFGVTEDEVLAPCPHCHYAPPPGYMCLTCHQGGNIQVR